MPDSRRSDDARRRLRAQMRERRRALSAEERDAAQRALARRIWQLGAFCAARRIAFYFAFDGEPDLTGLMVAAARAGKALYVPVLRGAQLGFARFVPGAPLAPNRLGILEPDARDTIALRRLDLVLTPLVAFDRRGVRLGVGAGYYDRSFAYLRQRSAWLRPKLLGVGYEFQRVACLEEQPWDVRLWGAVTEADTYRF